jgi:hypothetical protein
MKKYTVEVKYYVDIEAETKEQAEERGWELSLDVDDVFFVKENRRFIQPWASDVIDSLVEAGQD